MKDLTNEFNGSDVKLKVTGSKLTRLDLLLNKLDKMTAKLNMEQKISTIVYDDEEFVEKVTGTIEDTKEIIEYYNKNFVLSIGIRKNKNQVIVRMLKPISKSADLDEENKKPEL